MPDSKNGVFFFQKWIPFSQKDYHQNYVAIFILSFQYLSKKETSKRSSRLSQRFSMEKYCQYKSV